MIDPKNYSVLQWNCRGLKANFIDLELLLKSFSPAALCLQETLQGDNNVLKLRYYTNFYKNSTKADGTPGGGVAILVKKYHPS
jgi:exonuclease III